MPVPRRAALAAALALLGASRPAAAGQLASMQALLEGFMEEQVAAYSSGHAGGAAPDLPAGLADLLPEDVLAGGSALVAAAEEEEEEEPEAGPTTPWGQPLSALWASPGLAVVRHNLEAALRPAFDSTVDRVEEAIDQLLDPALELTHDLVVLVTRDPEAQAKYKADLEASVDHALRGTFPRLTDVPQLPIRLTAAEKANLEELRHAALDPLVELVDAAMERARAQAAIATEKQLEAATAPLRPGARLVGREPMLDDWIAAVEAEVNNTFQVRPFPEELDAFRNLSAVLAAPAEELAEFLGANASAGLADPSAALGGLDLDVLRRPRPGPRRHRPAHPRPRGRHQRPLARPPRRLPGRPRLAPRSPRRRGPAARGGLPHGPERAPGRRGAQPEAAAPVPPKQAAACWRASRRRSTSGRRARGGSSRRRSTWTTGPSPESRRRPRRSAYLSSGWSLAGGEPLQAALRKAGRFLAAHPKWVAAKVGELRAEGTGGGAHVGGADGGDEAPGPALGRRGGLHARPDPAAADAGLAPARGGRRVPAVLGVTRRRCVGPLPHPLVIYQRDGYFFPKKSRPVGVAAFDDAVVFVFVVRSNSRRPWTPPQRRRPGRLGGATGREGASRPPGVAQGTPARPRHAPGPVAGTGRSDRRKTPQRTGPKNRGLSRGS